MSRERSTDTDTEQKLTRLRAELARKPWSGLHAADAITLLGKRGDTDEARSILAAFERTNRLRIMVRPQLAFATLLVFRGDADEARALLDRTRPVHADDCVRLAELRVRLRDPLGAAAVLPPDPAAVDDVRVLVPWAHVLGDVARLQPDRAERRVVKARAIAVLRRILAVEEHPRTRARAWWNLAFMLAWSRAPVAEVDAAYREALAGAPANQEWRRTYEAWRAKQQRLPGAQRLTRTVGPDEDVGWEDESAA